MLDRPSPLPRNRFPPPPAAAGYIAWRLLYQFVLFLCVMVVLVLILMAVALFMTTASKAAGYGYCQLWARVVTEIEVRSGKSLELMFLADNLIFRSADDVDIAVADAGLVQIRNHSHFKACRFLIEYDVLPLPDVAQVQTPVWAKMLEADAVGRQGTLPAGEAPIAAAEGEGWAEACAAEWRSFDPADGTVVRPKSKGGKVRCPLVKDDGGLWVMP